VQHDRRPQALQNARGMPRREIVEGVIKKTVPLFGLVGAVKMGEQTEIPSQ
jgi:hypothetical protein